MKEKSFLSIVIYAYNQAAKLSKKVIRIDRYLSKYFENYEIVIVNNCSTDDTERKLNILKGKFRGNTTLVNLDKKQSIETAILAGTELAIGDFIVEIENIEARFNPSLISRLFKKCTDGFDLVSAIAINCRKESDIFYKIFNKINNSNLKLQTEPLRIITRRAYNQASRSKEKNRYRKIIYLNTGFAHETICYNSKRRVKSNKTWREKIGLALEMLLSFSDIGMNFTFFISLLFFLVSILIGIYTIYIYLTYKQVISGWTTTMLFLSFGFSGMFLITGILVKLITMVLSETKGGPQFSVRSFQRLK